MFISGNKEYIFILQTTEGQVLNTQLKLKYLSICVYGDAKCIDKQNDKDIVLRYSFTNHCLEKKLWK